MLRLRSLRPSALLVTGAVASLAAGCRDAGDASAPRLAGRPPIVLVLVDTLRADRLGLYGAPVDTSPRLDALAERAFVFEANTSQSNSTFPSITSILTGLYPRTHRNYVPVPLEGAAALGEETPSLAERLRAEGWYTMAVTSHPAWTDFVEHAAMMRGWDAWSTISADLDLQARVAAANAEDTNRRAFELLERWREEAPERPPFLWVHYFDPHAPYEPPAPHTTHFLAHHLERDGFADRLDEVAACLPDRTAELPPDLRHSALRALYDGEVAACDAGIARLLDRLDELGVLDEAVVVLLADHGENLHPHPSGGSPFTHDRLLDGVVRVPFVLRLPGQQEGRRISAITQSIDLLPTLVELLGLDPGPPVDGASLVPLLDGAPSVHERVFVESSDHVEKGVRTRDLKYVAGDEDEPPLLVRWREDPAEEENLAGRVDPTVEERLAALLDDFEPVDCLRVRLVPGAAPERVELALEADEPILDGALPVEGGVASDDGRAWRWSGTVADEPVELALFLHERGGFVRATVRREGAADVHERILLGRSPLRRTTALPLLAPGDAPPPEEPRLRVRTRDDVRDLELRLAAGERAELEVPQIGGYGQRPELIGGDFPPFSSRNALTTGGGKVHRTSAEGPGVVRARLRFPPADDLRATLVRVDGTWPPRAAVEVDGRAARTDVAELVLPLRRDGRLTAALLAGAPADPPPGAILVWLEGGGGGVEIDTSTLAADAVEQLRALGYVR